MNLNDLPGYVDGENIATFQKYVQVVVDSQDEVVVVDIGTLGGKSAISMAVVSDKVIVHTIDPTEDLWERIEPSVKKFGVEDRVKFYNMTSEEFGKNHCPPVIDVVFVDGLHDYKGVKGDIELICKKVRRGGYIMFHDKNLYGNTIGTAIKEYEGDVYAFIEEVGGSVPDRSGSVYVGRRL